MVMVFYKNGNFESMRSEKLQEKLKYNITKQLIQSYIYIR